MRRRGAAGGPSPGPKAGPSSGTRLRSSPSAGRRQARGERRVCARDRHVGLCEAHLGVVEEARKERPLFRKPGDRIQSRLAVRRAVRLEGRAEPEPSRQVDPCLRPRERPRDRPERVDRRAPGRGVLAQPAVTQGAGPTARDRSARKNSAKPGVVVDQRPIRGPCRHCQLVEDRRPDRDRPLEPRRRAPVSRRSGPRRSSAPGDGGRSSRRRSSRR